MKKPSPRPDVPPRNSENEKRRLHSNPTELTEELLSRGLTYHGISKHKLEPIRFGLPPYNRPRGDATLCDSHAGMGPESMTERAIRKLADRGLRAGLFNDRLQQGCPRILWSVHSSGWIFEARLSNAGLGDYHGYPVRPNEAIARPVFERFDKWAMRMGEDADRDAARACQNLYGFG